MKFDYTTTTQKDFNSAVATVQAEIANAGFNVLYVHDVHKTLDEKGLQIEPIKIVEFCDAKSAHTVLQQNAMIGLLLPCKIIIYTKNGETFISALRPTILPQFFPDAQLGTLPEKIDTQIKDVVDNSK